MRALGLMSGTSLDGIDAAYLDVRPRGAGYAVELLRFVCAPFEARLRERLLDALPPRRASVGEAAALDADLGRAFGAVARAVRGDDPLDFVASHGLTLFHDGDAHHTLQAGDPYAIRDAAGATVAFDFRRADCALGGQGAPLVPYADALLFSDPARDVVALNLGGIANVTVLERAAAASAARAWDTGPANMLLDAFVASRTSGRARFDEGGALALAGRVDRALLERLLDDSYFSQAPPKSTGRERFGAHYLEPHAAALAALSLEDGCATLAAFSVEAVARDIERFAPANARVVAGGGGTRNAALLQGLASRLGPGVELVTTAVFGVDPDAKEALAFALLGYELLRGRAAGLPAVTGASRPAMLGALAPYELRVLLAKMDAELMENAAE